MDQMTDTEPEPEANLRQSRPIEIPGMILPDGTIIDEIYVDGRPAFIVCDNSAENLPDAIDNCDIVEDYYVGDTKHIPINDDLVQKKKILLPSGILEYGSEAKLFAEIVEYVNRWAELDSDMASLISLASMSWWLPEKVPVFPIVSPRGASDTGKTRLGDVLWQIAFRGMRADGVLSLSSLFRNCDRWKGTLYINEGDMDESKWSEDSEGNQKIKFYNARIERNASVWRTNPNTFKAEVFDSFGATILTTRKAFRDDALESRLLVVPMMGLTRTDIPCNLPEEFYQKGQELRNKLELFRLNNLARFENDNYMVFGDLSSRMNQILQPVGSLAKNHIPELFEMVQGLAVSLSERVVEDRANSFDGQIVRAYFAIDWELKGVTAQTICNAMIDLFKPKDEPRHESVGRRAKALGFERFKSVDENRTRLLKLERTFAKRMVKKYLPKEERDELDKRMNPVAQATLPVDAPSATIGGSEP